MNRWISYLALAAVIVFSGIGSAQDAKDAPSQKTREALDKLNNGPGVIGKNLEALRGAVTGKLSLGSSAGQKVPDSDDPLGMPEKKAEVPSGPRYSSAGKRDPFQPLPLRAQVKRRPRENLSPLERYDLGQLQLVGIVWDAKAPRAMVEDAAGLGYVVGVGTSIGPNDGKIKEIKRTEVVIEETYIDFYGARKNRQVSMKLAAE